MSIYIEAPISLNYKTDSISADKRIRKKKIVYCETIIIQELLLGMFKLPIAV